PAGPTFFAVAPVVAGNQTTGTPFQITVTAETSTGAIASSYTGTISISSTDPAVPVLLPSYTFTAGDAGAHTFTITLDSSTLGAPIGTTIFARDLNATNPPVNGFSSPLTVEGLVVPTGAFQPTATGFSVTFSKPFTPADLTMYGAKATVQDVALV